MTSDRQLPPLKNRNFLFLAATHFLEFAASWVARVAFAWTMLELTGSMTAVGLVAALQFAPNLALGLHAGIVADAVSKRMIALITLASYTAVFVTTAGLLTAGLASAPLLYLLAVTTGLIQAFDKPARQALVAEVVGRATLAQALSINSAANQIATFSGPAIGAALLAQGGGATTFFFASALTLTGVVLLLFMHVSPPVRERSALSIGQRLREGISYAVRKPAISWTLLLLTIGALSGLNTAVVFADFADDVFQVGSGGFGFLLCCTAFGAVLTTVFLSRRRPLRLRTVVVAIIAFGSAQMLASPMPTYIAFCFALIAVGAGQTLFISTSNALVQSTATGENRGRVVSILVLLFFGGQSIGSFLVGLLCDVIGAPLTMAAMGATMILAGVVVGIIVGRRAGMTVRFVGGWPRIVQREDRG